MPIPTFIVRNEHPRVWARQTDRATYVARTNDSSGWQTLWDATIIPRANSLKAQTDSFLVQTGDPAGRLAVLAIAGWIEETGRPALGYKDIAIRAAKHLCTLSDSVSPTDKRSRLDALTVVFDFLYDDLTPAERDTLAAEMLQQIGRQSKVSTDQMDGWSMNDQATAIAAELALHGHASVAASVLTELNASLGFMYGAVANQGRIEMNRYENSDGGDERIWYFYYGLEGILRSLWYLAQATDLDTFTQESAWASKLWEWIVWSVRGGSYGTDLEPQGDTARPGAPWLHTYMRWVMGILATKYTNTGGKQGGNQIRWIFDQFAAKDTPYGDRDVWDVIFLDRANVASVQPKDATTPVPTSRLFSPPGIYYYRQTKRGSGNHRWDFANAATIRFTMPLHYWLGHPHLSAGSMRMDLKGDPVLLAPAGLYDDYSGNHHVNAYQRSWLHSLCPIITDPGQTYQRYGQVVANDGGQHFRKLDNPIAPSGESDPNYVYGMRNDLGGQAWLRCEAGSKLADDSNMIFLRANIREAYRKKSTDPHRVPICTTKVLIIEPTAANGLSWPAALVYIRIQKANGSLVTTIPFHHPQAITTTAYGWHTLGYFGASKLWVDVRSIGSYTLTNSTPGTPLDANGYGPNQFKILGQGANYPPSAAPNSRELPDLKRHSAYLQKTTQTDEEHYVFLMMLSEAADAEPGSGRAWVTDGAQPSFYGITIGSSTYLLHRTEDLAVFGSPDTTPPANVSGQALTPKNMALLYQWTDPADSDFKEAEVFYRTSAT